MTSSGSDMDDVDFVGETQEQGLSQKQGRSPVSAGTSPSHKKKRGSPDPVPIAREAVKWIRHTIQQGATKKTNLSAETQRNMFAKLSSLDTAIHDIVVANLQLKSQLEEARRSAEICVGAAAVQFGTELRLREASHEQTLEAVVTRYAEKEALREQEMVALRSRVGQSTEQAQAVAPVAATFAQVVTAEPRSARRDGQPVDRGQARSKSRISRRKKLLTEGKEEEHRPAYVVNPVEGVSVADISSEIWKKVMARKVLPKCQTVKTKTGKVVLKPLNKETADVLKSLAKDASCLQEEPLLWPRFIIRGVQTSLADRYLQEVVLDQNPELGIVRGTSSTVLKPVFKNGPRDRDVVNWVVEVNPSYYDNFKKIDALYIGFMKCRVGLFEEVTQCYRCLRYGHPAAKCNEKECTFSHCGSKGHLSEACPAADVEPICANCKGKHSARDRTCSVRTSRLVNTIRRTDYGCSK